MRVGSEIGGYRLEAVLGRGAMGTVYCAYDERLDRRVALKVVRAADMNMSATELRARFQREARAAARVSGPHVAQVLHAGETEAGDPWLAMELVKGRSLQSVLDGAPLLPERAVHIAAQLCAGMATAHARGVVHRDLKPANIMLVDEADDGDFVKILDFGIARLEGEPPLTAPGAVLGTVRYMAPEQLRGAAATEQSDIYAVGLILYEMLTGERAFPEENAVQLLAAQQRGLLWRPARRVAVPGGLIKVVDRCLAADAPARFATMRAIADALGPALTTPAVTVGGGPTTTRTSLVTSADGDADAAFVERRFEGERGGARVIVRAPGVLRAQLRGVLDEAIYAFVRTAADEATGADGQLTVFFDVTEMTGFSRPFRQRMFDWQRETRGRMIQIVLLRSRVVAAVIASANRIIGGGAEVTSNRERFERLYEERSQRTVVTAAARMAG